LFVSGFVDPALVYGQQVVQEAEILTKPFRRTDLAARLRAALRRPQQTVAAVETS
jgi:hypothetical protein